MLRSLLKPVLCWMLAAACGIPGLAGVQEGAVAVEPGSANVAVNGQRQFLATNPGGGQAEVAWSIQEALGGAITPTGLYRAPAVPGTYHVLASRLPGSGESIAATVVVDSLEETIQAKLRAVLPPAEQRIAMARLDAAKESLDGEGGLPPLDAALDGVLDAFQHALNLQAAQAAAAGEGPTPEALGRPDRLDVPFSNRLADYLARVKGILAATFGPYGNQWQLAFLHSGMGYSAGYVGGLGGSLSVSYGAGGQVQYSGGTGTEYVFDFRHFQHATFPTLQCSAGAGIVLGTGVNVGLNLQGIFFENWIFGFKQAITEYQGPFVGAEVADGVSAGLAISLGLNGSAGFACSCVDNHPEHPPATCLDFPLGPLTRLPITTVGYTVGFQLGGTLGAHLGDSIVGSLTKSYTPAPTTAVTSYLGAGTTIAGLRMAGAIMTVPAGTVGLKILAAGASILYGLYDDPDPARAVP